MKLAVTFSGAEPSIVHAHGRLRFRPYWAPIHSAYFSSVPRRTQMPKELTVITCNNGHPELGLFERSLDHQGLTCTVLGTDVATWVNSRDKPMVIGDALKSIETEYVMYADSRDALLIQSPESALSKFQSSNCDLLFGGDRLSFPPVPEFKRFEDAVPGALETEFRYLNAGAWIGRTRFAEAFFTEARKRPMVSIAPESEQGILRQVFMEWNPRVRIDYRCSIFLNIGFLFAQGAITISP